MLNSLWFEIQGQQITKISFKPIEGGCELDVITLATLFERCGVQLGTDWLAVHPSGYRAPIPNTSMDYREPGSG